MDVDLEALVVDHIIKSLCAFEQTSRQMCLVEVMNRVVNGLDPPGLVVLAHLGPVDATVGDVDICLDVEDASDTCLLKSLAILLELRIRPNEYVGVADLFEGEATHKVCICLLNMAVYDECLVHVSPHV